jgi:glycosyltransferase involved in cell wall biosynthesis
VTAATRALRIAVWHNLPSGGGRRLLAHHLDHLRRQGHELRIWTTPLGASGVNAIDVDQQVRPLSLRFTRKSWSPLPPWFVVADRLAAMKRHLDVVAPEIDAFAPDVLFANACQLLRATDLGRRVKAPGVLYLGEPYRWLYEASPTWPWAAKAASGGRRLTAAPDRRAWARQVTAEVDGARSYERILVNSRYSRDSVQRAYGLDSRVCYPGVDTALFSPGSQPRSRSLLSVGALVPDKRPHLVVDAVAALRRPLALHWVANVADPETQAAVIRHAARRGVELTVEVGATDEALVERLRTAMAMVYAPRLEPFGLAPLEAAACGTPVVALAEAGVRESVTDGVTGLLADDVAGMTRALERVTGEPGLPERLGRSARDHVAVNWCLEGAGQRLEAELALASESLGRP